jgi:hypothetical protein
MKLATSALGLAALAMLLGLAAADTCPTLRLRTKAPRTVRNNKLISVSISAKNIGTTAANDMQIAVSGGKGGSMDLEDGAEPLWLDEREASIRSMGSDRIAPRLDSSNRNRNRNRNRARPAP